MVAASPLRRYAWPVAATLAAVAIALLALLGGRPDPGRVEFKAAGVMLHIPPERVTRVRIVAGKRQWEFARGDTGGWTAVGSGSAPADLTDRIERGLRFLHVSAPERVLTPEEVAGTPPEEFGLDPPHYLVSIQATDAEPFTIQFGAATAPGFAQFARVVNRDELLILPRFVGEPWEKATGVQ